MRIEIETEYVQDLLEDLRQLTEGITGDPTLLKTTIDMLGEYVEDQIDEKRIEEETINAQLEEQYEDHLRYLASKGLYPYKSHRAVSAIGDWDDIPF